MQGAQAQAHEGDQDTVDRPPLQEVPEEPERIHTRRIQHEISVKGDTIGY